MRHLIYSAGVFTFFALQSLGVLSAPILLQTTTIHTDKAPSILDTLILETQRYYIVQLKGPVHEEQKESIQQLGIRLFDYLPHFSFIIEATPSQLKKLQHLPFIYWVGPYKHEYRKAPYIQPSSIFNWNEEVDLIVELFAGTSIDPVVKRLRQNGATIIEQGDPIIHVRGKRSALFFLERLPGVYWIDYASNFSPTPVITRPAQTTLDTPDEDPPINELTGYESGVKILQSSRLHQIGITGKDQIIGYSDTGLDVGVNDATLHADFVGQVHAAYALTGGDWSDRWGHGTHIAGSLVGTGKLSDNKLRASAYDAKLVVQSLIKGGRFRVPTRIGHLIFSPAYQDGARIHSNSWVSKIRWGSYSPYSRSIDTFIWQRGDFLVLFAVGNSGGDYNKDGHIDEGSALDPGTAKNVLTVGSSENLIKRGGIQMNWQFVGHNKQRWEAEPIAGDLMSNNSDGIAAFSSRGATRDHRIKPEILAPGTNILSTKSQISSKELWYPYNKDYLWAGGSSMSTAIAASGAALVRDYVMREKKVKVPTSALIKALIINGAVELFPGQFGDIPKKEVPHRRPNNHEGWGRMNTGRAVLETDTRKILFFDEHAGLATEETKEFLFTVTHEDEPITITLVYDDYPGATSTSKYLVNDLDLQATLNEKDTFYPNGLKEADRSNNVEGIDILAPKSGTLKVTIIGYNIPKGKNAKQPYALVVSGGVSAQ